jgi:voltage-gated potassium channel Kch
VNQIAALAEPLTIIVGDDALALTVAEEICRLRSDRVALLGRADTEFASAVAALGGVYVAGTPDRGDTLDRAGVRDATTIIAVSRDDQLNLHTVLLARDANPSIRIVLRQFNRTLAHKIEQNLPDCSVLSLAWHSAASYAATALDPTCIHGLQFPEPDGPLAGFVLRTLTDNLGARSVGELESTLGARVIAVNDDINIDRNARLLRGSRLCLFGTIERLMRSTPLPSRPDLPFAAASASKAGGWAFMRANPYLTAFAVAALIIFALGTVYFHASFGVDWLTAVYFVLSTMTTTGYGDMTPDRHHVFDIVMAIMLMLSGVGFTGIFIAFAASLLTRAQWVRVQGLRRIRRRGHIVVCGAGSIGAGVIELLLGFDKPLVVVEATPDAAMIERARDQGFDLLTGDASRDETLDLCNIRSAYSLISLTNVDTLNLEIALGARARNPSMPIVLRIADASFATSIARHFDIQTTYSAAALAAPVFAGLARMPGARGRITINSREFAIVEMPLQPEDLSAQQGVIPIAVARGQGLELTHDLNGLHAGDRILALLPLVHSEHEQNEVVTAQGWEGSQ